MRIRRFLSLLTFLLLGSAHLNAQVKVTGKVTDKVGTPIFATVKVSQGEKTQRAFTDEDGTYLFQLQPGLTQFSFSSDTSRVILMVQVPDQPSWEMETVRFNHTQIDSVIIYHQGGPEINKLEIVDLQKLVNTPVEKFLIYGTVGASSNNELTSNYNVRGGNYDENLVYVNGFLINRPFLTRSGQQEGLSFINTALVDNIYFSAGGFQANYGDKLSSVLDIVYKRPDSLQASAMASLLGVETHIGQGIGARFRYLLGARYRSNGYLLNSLPTKGNYNPVFWDAQLLTEFDLTEKWSWSVLGHISSNNYQFAPETQQTDFGTANEAYSFNIYFDGQEDTRFLTATVGTSLKYTGKKYSAATYLTMFKTDEREYFDIQGQYYINQLETDPSKEEYGDSIAVLGIGTFLNHARNRLQATIFNAYHDASWDITENDRFKWGMGVQQDQFKDVLSEWRMIDSAGYSLPQTGSESVDLFETIKGRLSLQNTKAHVFTQYRHQWTGEKRDVYLLDSIEVTRDGKKTTIAVRDTVRNTSSKWEFEIGVRGLYTSFNEEFMVTPRASLNFMPVRYVYHDGRFLRRSMRFRLSSGLYYQPPFYREFRTFTGGLNPEVQAQKSFHLVAGGDYSFYMWERDRPFKLTAETYYKYLWDINTYEVENVRTRYYADNNANGYATGLDVNLHGEFVPGIQSFFKLGVLSTKEDVLNDAYTNYYNAAGERIIKGYSEDQVVVDSAVVHPGMIRRPTDQRLTAAILFQDNMPGFERFSVQMGLIYGSRLPYGPPDYSRYKDTLTMKAYFRVDMGLSYDFLYMREKIKGKWYGGLQDAIISFEIFNLLGINNVLSKQWIQDVEGKFYSIPNYLTQRRFNLKLIVRI